MSLTSIKLGTSISELDSWGSVSALGSQILGDGDVKAYGKFTHGAPTDPVSAAYFGTSKGKFRLVYPFSEQATIVKGEVKITDESTGEARTFKTGDSWFVTKGTSTIWEVLSDEIVKHYLAFA
ncbi:cupin domain-containing protein [Paraburkholderia sp. HD33-4]|uniref:cupin domain-containing protein n=1 Tax=Paraburkholderia sp. HD33-4 TaxID=2883242 RepID=UPI001F1E0C9D|nr:cupin domain-containing protein [Paraburkholderia sp. HD33-4]